MKMKLLGMLLLLGTFFALNSLDVTAYSISGQFWSSNPRYYVNLSGTNLPTALAGIQYGADQWNNVGTSYQMSYGGSTNGSTLSYDGKNNVFFRADSSQGYLAYTSYWYTGSSILDADVHINTIYPFYTLEMPCNGYSLEGMITHEFGHFLGLNHSGVASATMYPSVGGCDTNMASLDQDDISAIQALYKGGSTNPPPPPPAPLPPPPPPVDDTTAPTVTITSPANGSRLPSKGNAAISVSASDDSGISSIKIIADGKALKTCTGVTSCSVNWNVGKVSAGSHVIVAEAIDRASNKSSATVSVTK